MQNTVFKRIICCGLVVVFLVSSGIPITGSMATDTIANDVVSEYTPHLSDEEVLVSCSTYGINQREKDQQVMMSRCEAEQILEKITTYAQLIAQDPLSVEAASLQQEIILLATKYGLVPEDTLAKLSGMQPPQQRLLPHLLPQPLSKVDEWFCNYAAAGEGSSVPVIILPRVIPFLLTPIPRLYYRWNCYDGFSSCGGLRSGTGFIAMGRQTGVALGFWGIGFSIFLPPIMSFGIIGYALYCTVDAEYIEYWPPNYAPEINAVYPVDGAINVPISTSELRFHIDDYENKLMNYTVTTTPNIGGGTDTLILDGTYAVPISGLEGTKTYHWTVSVSDGVNTAQKTFTFSTEPLAPEVTNPYPRNGAQYIAVNTSELQFHLRDPQGDLMDYTVETSPNIGSGGGYQVSEGTYSVPISGLSYYTLYTWYVNVTDGVHEKHEVFCFTSISENIMVLYPTDDTYVRYECPNTNFGSDTSLSLRNRGSGSMWEWSSFICFNLSPIPSNLSILDVYLRLYYYRYKDNNPAGHDVSIYRCTNSWDEMTMTYSTQPGIVPSPTTTSPIPLSINMWMSWDVTDDILKFLSGTYTNYGWKIMDEYYWGGANIPIAYLYSKENLDYIPFLVIQY